MNVTDKVCLITGGTKGIGAATALLFARKGAKVAVVGRSLTDAEALDTRKKLDATGAKVAYLTGDMGKPEDCARVVEETARQLGDVDVLVHSAGNLVPGGLFDVTPDAWMNGFAVHVHAVYHLCRAAVPAMKRKKAGSIVLISSTAGRRAIRTNIAYQAVKGAIPQLTRALAFELADDNVRVNCVAPGVIRTAFHDQMPEAVRQNNLQNRIPLHREGTPDQVASLIRECVENEYLTGETFVIDGGLTMRIC